MESTAASSWKVKRTATDLTLTATITTHAHWFIPVGVGVFHHHFKQAGPGNSSDEALELF